MGNPISIFLENWDKARAANDPNASFCVLGTVSTLGEISLRTVVLRYVQNGAFVLFVNNTGPKWKDLEATSEYEILIFWPSLMQQYRVRGSLGEISEEEMRVHWENKPYSSKLLDHFYCDYFAQSSVIDSRELLLSGMAELKRKFPEEVPFPDSAKGLSLEANRIEVWHGSPEDRLHHRHLYSLVDGSWEQATLVP